MQTPSDARLLRLFVGESDRHRHEPFYEAVVLRAREHHLAGATVLRSPMGYGHSSRLHTTKILRLSDDLSFVVEIVDTAEKIESFLPVLREMIEESGASVLVTWEDVKVLHYGSPR
jgi:PII-like signaling protein